MSGKTREREHTGLQCHLATGLRTRIWNQRWRRGVKESNRMIGGLHSTEIETQGPNSVFLRQHFSFEASPCPLLLLCFPTPDCSFAKICSGACVNKLAPSTFLNTHTHTLCTVTSKQTAVIHITQFNWVYHVKCLCKHTHTPTFNTTKHNLCACNQGLSLLLFDTAVYQTDQPSYFYLGSDQGHHQHFYNST